MSGGGDQSQDLDAWLAPFLAVMGRKTRRAWAPLYLRGLLGPGDRKSLQPMAARLGLSGRDQLQHFIASPAWDDGPLWTALAGEADRLVGGPDACLVIDDTALPKKGTLSVGVARQYCGALGKQANCQSLVSLTLARGEVPVPVGLRLFLPEAWTSDPERCTRAGVPEDATTPRSKGEIALSELDRLRTAGLRFGTVLADAGYGTGAAFRHGLDARGLRWAVGIVRSRKVYAADVRLGPPAGRARKPVPDQEPQDAEAVLIEAFEGDKAGFASFPRLAHMLGATELQIVGRPATMLDRIHAVQDLAGHAGFDCAALLSRPLASAGQFDRSAIMATACAVAKARQSVTGETWGVCLSAALKGAWTLAKAARLATAH